MNFRIVIRVPKIREVTKDVSKDSPKRVKAPCSDFSNVGTRTRVVLLGTAALSGRYDSSKAKYGWETDSGQVL